MLLSTCDDDGSNVSPQCKQNTQDISIDETLKEQSLILAPPQEKHEKVEKIRDKNNIQTYAKFDSRHD